jgi:DNA-binding beta-propeller fold protein YncE
MKIIRILALGLAITLAANANIRYCEVDAGAKFSKHGYTIENIGNILFAAVLWAFVTPLIPVLHAIHDYQRTCRDSATSPPQQPQTSSNSAQQLSARAVASSSPLLYVTDSSSNSVVAIDPNSGAIQGVLQLPGTGAPLGIAITPDGKFLWVCEGLIPSNPNVTEIEIIDTSSLQIVSSIPLGPLVAATWIAMTPDGKTAYVTNYGLEDLGSSSGAVDSILIIDVASRKVTGQIMPPLINPQHPEFGSIIFYRLAVSPDGTLLYAVSDPGIFVFDTLTHAQVNPPASALAIVNIPTFNVPGVNPRQDTRIVFHPNGTRAYYVSGCPAPHGGDVCLAVMDTKTNLLIDAVTLGSGQTTEPTGIGISMDGGSVLVKEFNSGDIIPIDTVTDTVGTHTAGQPQADAIFLSGALQ